MSTPGSAASRVRFRVYAQPPLLPAFATPVALELETAGPVGPGPSDARFTVVDAAFKRHAWSASRQYRREWLVPFSKSGFPGRPAQPGDDGHFDHIQTTDCRFNLAHTFAIATHTLNTWNRYLSLAGLDPVGDWYHQGRDPEVGSALEVLVDAQRDGASSAFGFVELGNGMHVGQFRHRGSMCLQPDIIAHEVGHQILFATLGFPSPFLARPEWTWRDPSFRREHGSFTAFHEAFSDLLAWLCSLQFATVREFVLANSDDDGSLADTAKSIGDFPGTDRGAPMVALRNIGDDAGRVADVPLDEHGLARTYGLSKVLSSTLHEVFVHLFDQARRDTAPASALELSRDRIGTLLAAAVGGGHFSADDFSFARFEQALLNAAAGQPDAIGTNTEQHIRDSFAERGLLPAAPARVQGGAPPSPSVSDNPPVAQPPAGDGGNAQ